MRITINGEVAIWEDGATLDEIVWMVAHTDRGVAASVDRVVVPKSAWATTALTDGAAVEVLVAAAGG